MRKIPEKHRQWLLQELPILEDKGILSAESRQPLEDYYSNQVESRVHRGAIVCAVLGALLISGGIILLLAHNWDDLSRTARLS
ncbi:MAG: DUF2157 domain-containing protein [Opitutae bacterium]|jgi:uncharacterized membrane protein|nr:DUF2157 domain-containing protein [Opitutae bacterium]